MSRADNTHGMGVQPRHRWFTLTEAACYLGKDVRVLRKWVEEGRIACEALPPAFGEGKHRHRRIRQQDLDEFLDSNYEIRQPQKHSRSSHPGFHRLTLDPR